MIMTLALFAAIIAESGCVPDPCEVGEPDSLFSEFVLVRDLMDVHYACFIARP